MAKTANVLINNALHEIGDPSIETLDSEDILQSILLSQMSTTVRTVVSKVRFRWGLQRTELVLKAKLTTGNVSATNGSTTVTSLSAAAVDADNFTNVAAGDFLRIGTDLDSYRIASTSLGATPDTLTLDTAYQGTTTTSSSYAIFQDTYAISDTLVDEILIVNFGQGRYRGVQGSASIDIVDLDTIYELSGGDLHQDTSGKPALMAEIGRNSSNNRQFVVWPYPDSAYLVELRHTTNYAEVTTLGTTPFGSDAPDIAYDVLESALKRRACRYDEDWKGVNFWAAEYNDLLGDLISREARDYRGDNAMQINTYRKSRNIGLEVRSQIGFDHQSAVRS